MTERGSGSDRVRGEQLTLLCMNALRLEDKAESSGRRRAR
jgi:hypothetical protein